MHLMIDTAATIGCLLVFAIWIATCRRLPVCRPVPARVRPVWPRR